MKFVHPFRRLAVLKINPLCCRPRGLGLLACCASGKTNLVRQQWTKCSYRRAEGALEVHGCAPHSAGERSWRGERAFKEGSPEGPASKLDPGEEVLPYFAFPSELKDSDTLVILKVLLEDLVG